MRTTGSTVSQSELLDGISHLLCGRPSLGVAMLAFSIRICVVALLLAASSPLFALADFVAPSPEELALKEDPTGSGAPAMIMYRESMTDDDRSYRSEYMRLKIFNEKGRDKYSSIELEYLEDFLEIVDVKARTIRPDGTIVTFDGKIYDKTVYRTKRLRVKVKAFAMPDVQPGSIIEFRYGIRRDYDYRYVPMTWYWEVQDEIPTRLAKFSVRQSRYPSTCVWFLTEGIKPKQILNGYELEMKDVPALKIEEDMPPKRMYGMRVQFVYSRTNMELPKNAADFWKEEAGYWGDDIQKFIGNPKAVREEVERVISPQDTAETKLRKLYARVHRIRNLTYEPEKTEKEIEKDKLDKNRNAADVLQRGFGKDWEITRLFVAMARAAGFEALIVRIASRDEYFFQQEWMNYRQLNSEIALVAYDGKQEYLDPGTPRCPFGLLSWEHTGTRGMALRKDQFAWVTTPMPKSGDASLERKGKLTLDSQGGLTGNLSLTWMGQSALEERLRAFGQDDVARAKQLEDKMKEWLPQGSTVKATKTSGWESAVEPLQAEFEVTLPVFASATGKRLLLPVSVLHLRKQVFDSSQREYPVYFSYPYRVVDDMEISIPAQLQVDALPPARSAKRDFGRYESSRAAEAGRFRMKRTFVIDGMVFPIEAYPDIRQFFTDVRTADEEMAAFKFSESAQRN